MLAAEAIGIDRIREWKERWFDNPNYIMSPTKTAELHSRAVEKGRPRLPMLFIGVACGLGSAVGGIFGQIITEFTGSKWLWIVGVAVGGLIGAFAIDVALTLLRSISGVLTRIVERTGNGTIGVIGFVLLAVGFTLQALGTIPSLLVR